MTTIMTKCTKCTLVCWLSAIYPVTMKIIDSENTMWMKSESYARASVSTTKFLFENVSDKLFIKIKNVVETSF